MKINLRASKAPKANLSNTETFLSEVIYFLIRIISRKYTASSSSTCLWSVPAIMWKQQTTLKLWQVKCIRYTCIPAFLFLVPQQLKYLQLLYNRCMKQRKNCIHFGKMLKHQMNFNDRMIPRSIAQLHGEKFIEWISTVRFSSASTGIPRPENSSSKRTINSKETNILKVWKRKKPRTGPCIWQDWSPSLKSNSPGHIQLSKTDQNRPTEMLVCTAAVQSESIGKATQWNLIM